jgi:hypothetical protein
MLQYCLRAAAVYASASPSPDPAFDMAHCSSGPRYSVPTATISCHPTSRESTQEVGQVVYVASSRAVRLLEAGPYYIGPRLQPVADTRFMKHLDLKPGRAHCRQAALA